MHVTLVHGTWARGAPWTQQGSMLRDFIALRTPRIEFSRFDWSGQNSHRARLLAAHGLRRQLVAQRAAHPAARHFVIAHSHGGNVALYALRDPHVQAIVDGVICLNTPFVAAMRRSLGGTFRGPATLLAAVGLMCILFPFFRVMISGGLGRPVDVVGLIVGTLAAFALFFGMIWLVTRYRWIKRLKARQWKLLKKLRLPRLSKSEVTCLWSAGDEVHDFFQLADTLTNLPYALLRVECFLVGLVAAIVWQFVGHFSGHLELFPYYELIPWIGELIDDAIWVARQNASAHPLLALPEMFIAIWFSAVLYVIAAFVGLEILAVLVNGALTLLPSRVNSLNPFDAHYVRVGGTLTPSSGGLIQFQDFESEFGRPRHSLIYDDQAVLRYIAKLLAKSA